jgi:RNA polymerase sigma factor (sigma-70 family)
MARVMDEVVQHVRWAVLQHEAGGLPDAHLLGCFIERQDEAAAAALVQRHGPMVWGVCRRILHNDHDAEDAFQATFLVLVRRAASITPREMVGNWLYGVAHQTALKARAMKAKRGARERQVMALPEPKADQEDQSDDRQAVLDQELSRLPAKYRVAIVLCDLEGKTRKEAAQQLGVPDGTLAARLARARTMLGKRLARQGLAVSGGALATILSQKEVSAGVPTGVASSTLHAMSQFAAGTAAASGGISLMVAALTEGVLKAMLVARIKGALVVLLAVAFVGMGGVGLLRHMGAAEPPQAQRANGPSADVGQPGGPKPEQKVHGPEMKQASKKEITELVKGLCQADVKWDGQWIGIVAILHSERARRLGAIGEPAIPELIQAMSDKEKFASAHAILTMIASGGQPKDLVPCANGIVVDLPAEGPVSINPAQRFDLKRRWQKWYETSPRPKSLPR